MKEEDKTVKVKSVETKSKYTSKDWLAQYAANYEGSSKEAKSLEGFIKSNYKKDTYVPWATAERLVYMQDPDAELIVQRNEEDGVIFTETKDNLQKRVVDGIVKEETFSVMYSHFVRVVLVFLGKIFVEEYPIQDESYNAAKVYNQNLVNRAIQRAKAKVIARGTGLGLKLYEGKDLQFDETPTPDVPVATKAEEGKKTAKAKSDSVVVESKSEPVEVVVVPKVETPVETMTEVQAPIETPVEVNSDVETLIKLIKETPSEKITPVLQTLNVSVLKTMGFVLSTNETVEELRTKISKFNNVTKFITVIKSRIGE